MMRLWAQHAWEDYVSLQSVDKQKLKRINALIKNIQPHPFEGIGPDASIKNIDWFTGWMMRV